MGYISIRSQRLRGFTLIELLVAVGIIAILSVVAVAFFGSASTKARDAKRRSDVDAIAKAYELVYDGNEYRALAAPDFTTVGGVPKDPKTSAEYGGASRGLAADRKSFRVCADLETVPGADDYCKASSLSSVAVVPPCQQFNNTNEQSCLVWVRSGTAPSGSTKYIKCADIVTAYTAYGGGVVDCNRAPGICQYNPYGPSTGGVNYYDDATSVSLAGQFAFLTQECAAYSYYSRITVRIRE